MRDVVLMAVKYIGRDGARIVRSSPERKLQWSYEFCG
jgi:hypothetical protein